MRIIKENQNSIKSFKYGTITNGLYESSLSRIMKHSENGFFTLSASRGNLSEEENLKRHNQLKKDVRESGLGFIELYGGYMETNEDGERYPVKELSLFVPYIDSMSVDEFHSIAKVLSDKYKQEAYIFCDPNTKEIIMYEGDNEYNLGKFNINQFGDYFSQLKKGTKNQKEIKYVFEGVTVPCNIMSRHARSLGGEIF